MRRTDTEVRISTSQSSPRELRNLDRDVVSLLGHEVDRSRNVLTNDRGGRDIDKVDTEDLGNEGERTRGTEVALDDLENRFLSRDRLANDLHVERTRDLERLGDFLSDDLETRHVVFDEREGRKDNRGVSRVNSGVLDVFRNGVDEEFTLVGDGVDIDLLGLVDELGDDGRVLGRDFGSGGEGVFESRLVPDNVHGGAREYVRRSDQDGVSDSVRELFRGFDTRGFGPRGLINTVVVEDRRELVSVLGRVDHLGVGTEN